MVKIARVASAQFLNLVSIAIECMDVVNCLLNARTTFPARMD